MPFLLLLIAWLFWLQPSPSHAQLFATPSNVCFQIGADGWTKTNGCETTGTGTCGDSTGTYTGTCIVYVSDSAGVDATCAAQLPPKTDTPAAGVACKTIAKGISLLRGFATADWFLLKRGDTFVGQDFDGSGTTNAGLCRSGISSTQPLYVGNFGTTGARPIVEPNASSNAGSNGRAGFMIFYGGGGCTGSGNNIALIGLDIYGIKNDPNGGQYTPNLGVALSYYGIWHVNAFDWFLVEDTAIRFMYFGGWFNSDCCVPPYPARNGKLTFNRVQIYNNYISNGVGQGVFISNTSDIELKESIVDHKLSP